MSLNQHLVNGPDHFEYRKPVQAGLVFPCCVCVHGPKKDTDDPCADCKHNDLFMTPDTAHSGMRADRLAGSEGES